MDCFVALELIQMKACPPAHLISNSPPLRREDVVLVVCAKRVNPAAREPSSAPTDLVTAVTRAEVAALGMPLLFCTTEHDNLINAVGAIKVIKVLQSILFFSPLFCCVYKG
jgi:hypothetical protein